MNITYRAATIDDIDFLVQSRLDFIEISDESPDFGFIKANIREYFLQSLQGHNCDVILAECGTDVVGTGIVFYYSSVPSGFNPWGKNAYITSMFVRRDLRRRGIASSILDRLIRLARSKGYHVFLLQESELGRPLYQKFGFTQGEAGMILKDE